MKSNLIVLKLGGSVLTFKEKPMSPNFESIRRLSNELARALSMGSKKIILIHGGGSFGHPIACHYKIAEGFIENDQLFGFAETHAAMLSLNRLILQGLLDSGVPALGMAPSSFIMTKKGRIHLFNYRPLLKALEMRLTPVLYGDAVLDVHQGFSILSGDQIAAHIAVKFGAEKMIMGVDVDGLYDSDPKLNSAAQLIIHATVKDLKRMCKTSVRGSSLDVTGGMMGKIRELIEPANRGVQILIVNASKQGNIEKALKGEEVIGTKITT
ncbi:MAG: isopentenyl phosphate kinase [Nitrososphaerota archaeon]|nr:isopentenyl phosphate kinase [Candidatus Bathyarchaeota archaeon]MDW8048787.1 isopentenyl phosphate kinase [Nitrososphaerota archaeon]